jgi:adenylyl-sulfate kinase
VSRPTVIWLTGLPCSGKSTIARLVSDALGRAGVAAAVLDGDVLRAGPCADLGFSHADRLEQARRASLAAKDELADGRVAIVATISPYDEGRAIAREVLGPAYVEVFVDAGPEVCEARDVRGMWARARAGELDGFTGVSDPYEPPTNPDLRLDTAAEHVGRSADRVLALLAERGVVDPDVRSGAPA